MNNKYKINDIDEKIKNYYSKNFKSKYRNYYHFQAPFGLINDPNGLSYFNNEYNIFFQWNPFSCEHKFKHWGLVKTKDFINYTIPKIVLEPKEYYDKNGCYSGSAIEKDGILEILYTGNVKNEKGERMSYQCRAIMDKNNKIKKLGPIVDVVPNGYTAHFRDPKIYMKGEKYFFIIGAQDKKLRGDVLLYSSYDSIKWKLEGQIETLLNQFGYMWECPNLITMNNKDILIFSPQGLAKQEFEYQNIYQSGYVVGKLDYNTLKFNHGKFYELDKGFDFYAPQTLEYNKRIIMIAWMGVPEEYEDKHKSVEENWIHCLTMPRELILKNNKIYQKPIEELRNLRIKKYFSKENLINQYLEFSNINNNCYEVMLDLIKSDNFNIKIEIYRGSNESFELNIDKNLGNISRENLLDGPKGVRKFKLLDDNKNLKINIFVDKSAVEIYLNEGEVVLSSRVFPRKDSLGFSIKSLSGLLNIKELKIWSLEKFKYK